MRPKLSPRYTQSGRDVLTKPPQTVWQRERTRGPILPMEEKKTMVKTVKTNTLKHDFFLIAVWLLCLGRRMGL